MKTLLFLSLQNFAFYYIILQIVLLIALYVRKTELPRQVFSFFNRALFSPISRFFRRLFHIPVKQLDGYERMACNYMIRQAEENENKKQLQEFSGCNEEEINKHLEKWISTI